MAEYPTCEQSRKQGEERKQQRDRQRQEKAIQAAIVKAAKKSGDMDALKDLGKFAINCAICLGLTWSSNAIADLGFVVRDNVSVVMGAWDSCWGDPIGCTRGKYWPRFRIGKPTDNITATLDLIAYAEGADYDVIYTGERFSDFSEHPDRVLCARGICSSAAGRYQFLTPTWQRLQNKLNLPDFSPASQDKAAIELLKECGGYGSAVRGEVKGVADRCWGTWASLKSSKGQKLDDRQHAYPIEHLQAKYLEFLRGRGDRDWAAPLSEMRLTSPMMPNRIHPVTGKLRPHNGADYACTIGQPVYAPQSGIFRQGNSDPEGFGGRWGYITTRNGAEIKLGHTSAVLVEDGAEVKAGSIVAKCGAEGTGTGAHLHVEIRRNGQLIDPAKIF
jgi:muramidase (phage lysozyme)